MNNIFIIFNDLSLWQLIICQLSHFSFITIMNIGMIIQRRLAIKLKSFVIISHYSSIHLFSAEIMILGISCFVGPVSQATSQLSVFHPHATVEYMIERHYIRILARQRMKKFRITSSGFNSKLTCYYACVFVNSFIPFKSSL